MKQPSPAQVKLLEAMSNGATLTISTMYDRSAYLVDGSSRRKVSLATAMAVAERPEVRRKAGGYVLRGGA
ncbi:MAG: hypothetical protein H0U69_03460 [Trueperaceae bacterium]|nr:hypothetical protein [Trueperaceae bacterium]